MRSQVERHGGRVVKSQGDGFMVVLGAPQDAVAAAQGIQRRAASGRRARRARVRVGFGRNVAKAARIAALAGGGQTLVSAEVQARLDGDEELEPVGAVELRGLAGEHDLYAVAG